MEKLSLLLLFASFSFSAKALLPLKGIIYGELKKDMLYDPLDNIFEKKYKTITKETINSTDLKMYDYVGLFVEGQALQNTCERDLPPPKYLSPWKAVQAERSVIATMQYITLDVLTRAIAKYAKKLKWRKGEYYALVDNMVGNYCSKNVSVYSLKLLKDNLLYKFDKRNFYQLPSWENSEFFPLALQKEMNTDKAREKEFSTSIKLFRNICSWNGKEADYRMLGPYLKNPYIMSFVFKNLDSREIYFDFQDKKLKRRRTADAVQVTCENMICRKSSKKDFEKKFPRMIGSSSLYNDLSRLYCSKFRKLEVNEKELPKQVKNWFKNRTMEEEVLEQSQLLALFTGASDPLFSTKKYSDLKNKLMSNIEQRWTKWTNDNLNYFDNDLLYEESLQIAVIKENKAKKFNRGEFAVNLEVSIGETDKMLSLFDKIKMSFKLSFPKSFFKYAWRAQRLSSTDSKMYERDQLVHHLLEQFRVQLVKKENRILLTPWDSDKVPGGGLEKIIVPEIMRQLDYMSVSKLEELPENVQIPITMYYGNFALKFMRYKFQSNYRSKGIPLTYNK